MATRKKDDDVAVGEIVVSQKCQHVYERSGKRCTRNAIDGYPLCQDHLERASVREIRLVRGNNTGTFEEMRGREITNPLEELAGLVSEVMLYKDYTAQRVAELRGQERYEGKTGEMLRAEVALYERSLDRVGKLLIDWSRLNIDERLAKIEERKAQQMIDIIRGALLQIELTDEARARVEAYIVRELRAAGQ